MDLSEAIDALLNALTPRRDKAAEHGLDTSRSRRFVYFPRENRWQLVQSSTSFPEKSDFSVQPL